MILELNEVNVFFYELIDYQQNYFSIIIPVKYAKFAQNIFLNINLLRKSIILITEVLGLNQDCLDIARNE